MAELPQSIRKAIEDTNFWHVATVNPDGSPHSTAVWVDMRGDRILVNTAKGRKKHRNLERDQRVAMSWHTHDGGAYHSAGIQGRAVESYDGDRAERDIDDLAQKYIGQSPYPWRSPGEQRISYLIEPTHSFEMGE